MRLRDLALDASKRAKKTAINAFERFIASEDANMGFIASCLLGDDDGSVFLKLMDRFAVYLAFVDGRSEKPLARNSVMSYYRHVKNWLLDRFPKHRAVVEKQLLKMAQTLERYCLKRVEGGVVKKAPACTKEDLRILIDGLYYDAASCKDYQDAALLALMWYTFGRASDLGYVAKNSLSVSADGVVFVRLIRVKTSEEQGLSLFPDRDGCITCPLYAIDVALVMQDFPSAQVLELPQLLDGNAESLAAPTDVQLVEALSSCSISETTGTGQVQERRDTKNNMKIHAYVNRVVKASSAAQEKANPTPNLTSHSFRHGGAQHAHSDPLLGAQWIFDRKSWNMAATSKAFTYVFNTTSEDQKVSRMWSGWDPSKKPAVPLLSWFDLATKNQAMGLAGLLFQLINTQDPEKRINDRVIDVLVAALIQRFPEVIDRYPMCPYATRMQECLFALKISKTEVLAWSSELQKEATLRGEDVVADGAEKITREARLINPQNCVIGELVSLNQELAKRVSAMEDRITGVECGEQLSGASFVSQTSWSKTQSHRRQNHVAPKLLPGHQ